MYSHQVHDLKDAMRHTSRTSDCNFHVGQSDSKISMDQFTKTSLLVNTIKFVQAGPVTVCHHAIVCTHNTGKKSKTNDALTILMFQAFVIDQSNFFIKDRLHHLLIMRLLLFSMRKKQVSFSRQQLVNRDLLYSHK